MKLIFVLLLLILSSISFNLSATVSCCKKPERSDQSVFAAYSKDRSVFGNLSSIPAENSSGHASWFGFIKRFIQTSRKEIKEGNPKGRDKHLNNANGQNIVINKSSYGQNAEERSTKLSAKVDTRVVPDDNIMDAINFHLKQTAVSESKKNNKKKKKRRKRKKRKKKGDKDKKKKGKKRKKKQQYKPPILGQQAHVIFATVTEKPSYWHPQPTTTKHHALALLPTKKIKYLWKKHNILKKKKKEYFNHIYHVFLPFLKFVTFFTILNPFTLAVFLFSLISPVVFSFLGFMALSALVKPLLHLLFDVKHRVNIIKRKKLQALRRQQRRRQRRPITIHKHYYQNRPIPPSHPPKHSKWRAPFNPILPHVRNKLKRRPELAASFESYERV